MDMLHCACSPVAMVHNPSLGLKDMLWAVQEVVRQRPDDPLEFLGQYLLKHNPKKSAVAGAAAATASAGAPK